MSEAVTGQVRTVGERPARLTPVTDVADVLATPYASGPQTVTVTPQEVDLNLYQGDDFYLDVQVTDLNSNPINVTGSAPLSQIRATPQSPATIASFTITIDGTTTGLLHLHLAASDANNLPPEAVWDLQLSSPSVTTIAAGKVTVTPQVSQ